MSSQRRWSRPPVAHSLLAPHSVEDLAPFIAEDHKIRKIFVAGRLSTKRRDTVGEPQGLVFQCPNVFPGIDAARLKAQIQAIDPIMWHFVADALDKPLN